MAAVVLCIPLVHVLLEGSMTLQMLVLLAGLFCAGCSLLWPLSAGRRERIALVCVLAC
ncbi:hypothetical protein ACU4HD_45245 (plasmid) [Cupriavidus basilensis]